ncbi:MAG: peroxidase family protein [Pseudomonadales bacterium]|jgi:hypothetical protein
MNHGQIPKGSYRLFTDAAPQPHPEHLLERLVHDVMHSNSAGESNIPAGFTYLGQFVAHDMSHLAPDDAGDVTPSPSVDLDVLYGGGYYDPALYLDRESGFLFADRIVAKPLQSESLTDQAPVLCGFDVPRSAEGIAKIPDQRNDDSLLVSQIHALWLQVHNYFCAGLDDPLMQPRERFEQARKLTTALYQAVILDDFLTQIVKPAVYKTVIGQADYNPVVVLPQGLKNLGIPVEVAAAAFRFGHSMVLPSYNINKRRTKARRILQDFFVMTGRFGLNNHAAVPAPWLLDWTLFFELDGAKPDQFNHADIIKPVTNQNLKDFDDSDEPLPLRTLKRGNAWRLPSGQQVAREMRRLLEAADSPFGRTIPNYDDPELFRDARYVHGTVKQAEMAILLTPEFRNNTPLWYFLLAEDWLEHPGDYRRGNHLGTIGSILVAETLLGLIKNSAFSIRNIPDGRKQHPVLVDAKRRFEIRGKVTMGKIIQKLLQES